MKDVINIKNINSADYAVVKKKGDELVICDNLKYCRAKILLKKEFCDINIINPPSPKKKVFVKTPEENIENEYIEERKVAPPILFLNEEEMFKDAEGTILDIEVRGERDRKKIYFRMIDIAKEFNSPNLRKTLLNDGSDFQRNIHYKTFTLQSCVNNYDPKNTSKKLSLFLTYKGLLRFLFVSRNKCAEAFQDWAEDKLFTMQMGETDKKEELAAEALNVNVKDLRLMLKKHASTFPSIYLLKIAKVADIRKKMNIPDNFEDDAAVYKYGMTSLNLAQI